MAQLLPRAHIGCQRSVCLRNVLQQEETQESGQGTPGSPEVDLEDEIQQLEEFQSPEEMAPPADPVDKQEAPEVDPATIGGA